MEVRWIDEVASDPKYKIGEEVTVMDSDDIETIYYYDGWDADTLRVRLVK